MAKKVFKYRIYCETESAYVYTWGDSTPTTCPNNNGHTITNSTISVVDQVSDIVSYGDVSDSNSTSTPLVADASWTGTSELVVEYSSVSVFVHSDVASATDGLELQLSSDGANWDRIKKITLSNGGVNTLAIVSKYFRVKYTNGSSPQSEFRLQTIYHRFRGGDLTSTIEQTVENNSDVTLTKSIISGKKPSGVYENVLLDDFGKLQVSSFNKNIFGEGVTVDLNLDIQNYTPYGIINNQLYDIYSYNGGSVTGNVNGVDVDLNITDGLYSYAVLRSKRVMKYRPGVCNMFRGSCRFTTPVANSLQFIGLGNVSCDLYFAYDGTSFGIRHSTGGYPEVRKLTIDQHETSNNKTGTVTLNGTTYDASLEDADVNGGNGNDSDDEDITYDEKSFTASQMKYGNSYSGWNTEQIKNTIVFTARDVGAKNGSYSFSSTGAATGTMSQLRAGTALNTTFIPQSSWNGSSTMVTDLNPLKNNLYQIEYSWFGSSNIVFKVLNPENGQFETVHTLKFANNSIEPSLSHPNMFIQQGLASLGSSSAMTISSGCTAGITMGKTNIKPPFYSIANQKSYSKKTETVLLAIKNRNSINGIENQSKILISKITATVQGSKPVKISIIKNPTTVSSNIDSDHQNYHYVDEANSLTTYDKMSRTYTGGELLDIFYVSQNNHLSVDFNEGREIELHQFDVILITAYSDGNNVTDVSVRVIEDL